MCSFKLPPGGFFDVGQGVDNRQFGVEVVALVVRRENCGVVAATVGIADHGTVVRGIAIEPALNQVGYVKAPPTGVSRGDYRIVSGFIIVAVIVLTPVLEGNRFFIPVQIVTIDIKLGA